MLIYDKIQAGTFYTFESESYHKLWLYNKNKTPTDETIAASKDKFLVLAKGFVNGCLCIKIFVRDFVGYLMLPTETCFHLFFKKVKLEC